MKNKLLLKNIRRQIYAKKSTAGSIIIAMLITTVGISTFLIIFPERAEAAAHTDFSNYKKLTIESDFIEATLTNFPILVHDNTGDLLGNVLSNASDIAFFNTSKATQFNHEIEYYNVSTGELWAWVNVTSISNTVDTVFYMYYNDSDGGYPVDYNPTSVWDSDFLAVYHLNETTGGYNDSTANYNNATLVDADTDTVRGAAGEIDGCIDFNGDADYIDVSGTNPSILGNGSDDLTISLWVNPDNIAASSWLFITGDATDGDDFITIGLISSLPYYRVKDNADDCVITGLGELSNNSWFYLTLVWDASEHKLDAYENKTLLGTDTDAAVMPADHLEYDTIGAYRKQGEAGGINWHDGSIDEVQISRNITRSRAWLNASFDNQNETTGFLTIESAGFYYGFGDSIMRATKTGSDLAADGSDCYVLYMQGLYDPSNGSDHNSDGGGKTTNWGYANWSTHITSWDWYVIEAFGVNDVYYDGGNDADGYPCSASIAASNKLEMYNWSVENDSETSYLPMILTLADDDVDRPRATQLSHINTTMNLLENYSVRFVKLFDAIDTVPYNGRIDSWDTNYYFDNVHPQLNGHQAMGSFLWFFINGSDYTETYYAGNDTITIQAHYNETIYVYPRSGWDASNVVVTCVTNSTIIGSDESVDVEGNATIRFTILNESSYEIVTSASPTQSSPSPTNNSINQVLTPTLSITVDDSNNLDLLNVTWNSNSSGSWINFGTNNSIDISGGAVTVNQTNSNFSELDTTYYWRINVSDGNNTDIKTYNFETMGDVDPPYNGSSSYDVGTFTVNLTWSGGNYSDREVVVQNNNSYPTSPTDGWVRQNSTATFFNESVNYSTYFAVWSYNDTVNLYSETGLDIPWGAMGLSCFDENHPQTGIVFDIEISNSDFTTTYAATNLTNIHYLDLYDIPFGTNTIFLVSSDGYESRTETHTTIPNVFYNFTFYLPPALPPGGSEDPEYDENETYGEDYIIRVVGPLTEYGADPPIGGALVTVSKYINTTDSYEEIFSDTTAANGEVDLPLVPGTLYHIVVTHDDYYDADDHWTPTEIVFSDDRYRYIRMTPLSGEDIPGVDYDIFWDAITFTATMTDVDGLNGTITITYSDSNSSTTNTQIYVYEYWNGTKTLIATISNTSENSFTYTTGVINTTRVHSATLFFNNTANFDATSPVTIIINAINVWSERTPFDFEARTRSIFGDAGFLYATAISAFLAIMAIVMFGPHNTGIGILACGFTLGFTNWLFTALFTGGFNASLALYTPIIIIVGAMYILVKDPGGHL